MVGFYFDRRRGLAAGISSAGAGVGMLVLSLLAAFLAEHYGWKGCLIIMAGVCLQCILCGALMRSLVPTLKVLQPNAFLSKDEDERNVAKSEPVNNRFISSLPVIKENMLLNCGEMTKTNDAVLSDAAEDTNDSELSPQAKLLLARDTFAVEKQQSASLGRRVVGVSSCIELTNVPAIKSSRRRVSEDNMQSMSTDCQLWQELSSSSNKTKGENLGIRSRRSASVLSDPVMPLMKKDIFYSGSMASLHSSRSRLDKEAGFPPLPEELYHRTAYGQKSAMSRAVHILKEMLDVSIMVNLSFVVICAANVFIQLGYFVPIVFLPAYGLSLGLSAPQAATLLAVLGKLSLSVWILSELYVIIIIISSQGHPNQISYDLLLSVGLSVGIQRSVHLCEKLLAFHEFNT